VAREAPYVALGDRFAFGNAPYRVLPPRKMFDSAPPIIVEAEPIHYVTLDMRVCSFCNQVCSSSLE
jgi:hypothetical protein